MIMFGSVYGNPDAGETWMLDFTPTPAWQKLDVPVHPSARSSASMVYDPVGQRVLLFGGYDGSYQNDVWVLTLGASPAWTQLPTQGSLPIGRHWDAGVLHA